MRRFGWLLAVLFFILPGFAGCKNPSNSGGPPEPEPEPEGLRAGLYAFSGDYVPGETETTAEPVPALPFSVENAFAVIRAAETPRSYLMLVDRDFSFLASVSLPEGVAVALKGLGGERVVQFYNSEAGGSLFSLSGGQTLILDENITLLGSRAGVSPLVTVGKDSRLIVYGGASIREHGGNAVLVSAGGEFSLEGGAIASCGGGVSVAVGGVFAMNGGSVDGNGGNGVSVGGVFAMSGGSIAGNDNFGVDVYNGSFTLYDGGIAGNSRGVRVFLGTFVMKGGGITGNSSGGGVVNDRGAFAMESGSIAGNHNTLGGGGVRGAFSISGGSITENTSEDPNPLYKNINAVPVVLGDAFVIEGYREVAGISEITLRDVNGYVKTRASGGMTYACSALVIGVGDPPQEVNWSLAGNSSGNTSLDSATGALTVGRDEAAETLIITATSVVRPEVSLTLELGVDRFVENNLKAKLGITASGNSIAVVTEVFNALHEYIAAGHLSGANEKNIGVGDYVDLYRLRVSDTVAADYNGGTIDLMNVAAPNDKGATLRIAVVGVNSYKGLDGNGSSAADDHLVLQFQNAVVSRRGNDRGAGPTGYAESEMRKYLSPVKGFESSSGCFYNGLVAAGIPAAMIYSPRRTVSKGAWITIVEDPVWLTAGDMSSFTVRYSAEAVAVAPAFCVR